MRSVSRLIAGAACLVLAACRVSFSASIGHNTSPSNVRAAIAATRATGTARYDAEEHYTTKLTGPAAEAHGQIVATGTLSFASGSGSGTVVDHRVDIKGVATDRTSTELFTPTDDYSSLSAQDQSQLHTSAHFKDTRVSDPPPQLYFFDSDPLVDLGLLDAIRSTPVDEGAGDLGGVGVRRYVVDVQMTDAAQYAPAQSEKMARAIEQALLGDLRITVDVDNAHLIRQLTWGVETTGTAATGQKAQLDIEVRIQFSDFGVSASPVTTPPPGDVYRAAAP
jgi:hypothetical protein